MEKVELFRADLAKHLAANYAGVELTEEKLHEIERWVDKYIHENWVVLGSFHIKVVLNEAGQLVLQPDNLFSGVLLEKGRVKMDRLEEDRYIDDDAVWLWRNKELFKCLKPETPHTITIPFNLN